MTLEIDGLTTQIDRLSGFCISTNLVFDPLDLKNE